MSIIRIGVVSFLITLSISAPAFARDVVPFSGYPEGTIVVKTSERKLYYVTDNERAVRYPVGVGKAGMQWTGSSAISEKRLRPDWALPDDLARASGKIPTVIRGGAPNNPMGAAALVLSGGDYAIHGTNNPRTIGGFVSHGCIRMHNADVMDLFRRVTVGTPVIVTR
jgi:lipoprotein-anchoring transpeptidase ErfK/SrfK